MFPFPIATPQKCDIQTFYGDGDANTVTKSRATWNKPVGVSHVYMMLIGAGGNGDGTSGGGSGAVTVFYCAAQHVPNSLFIWVGPAQSTSYISIDQIGSFGFLTANGATTSTAGPATTAPALAASGFYQSVAGQDGASASVSASATTFLSGGSFNTVFANYGYLNGGSGFFRTQPIIVGVGGRSAGKGGIGCGGGSVGGAEGGPGMVLIASW